MGVNATDPFVSRDAMARHAIDVFGRNENAEVSMNRRGEIIIHTSGGTRLKSRAERFHGDLRFKPSRRRRRSR